jgi:hypothetical protein
MAHHRTKTHPTTTLNPSQRGQIERYKKQALAAHRRFVRNINDRPTSRSYRAFRKHRNQWRRWDAKYLHLFFDFPKHYRHDHHH